MPPTKIDVVFWIQLHEVRPISRRRDLVGCAERIIIVARSTRRLINMAFIVNVAPLQQAVLGHTVTSDQKHVHVSAHHQQQRDLGCISRRWAFDSSGRIQCLLRGRAAGVAQHLRRRGGVTRTRSVTASQTSTSAEEKGTSSRPSVKEMHDRVLDGSGPAGAGGAASPNAGGNASGTNEASALMPGVAARQPGDTARAKVDAAHNIRRAVLRSKGDAASRDARERVLATRVIGRPRNRTVPNSVSRKFVQKIKNLDRRDWRSVLRELEIAEQDHLRYLSAGGMGPGDTTVDTPTADEEGEKSSKKSFVFIIYIYSKWTQPGIPGVRWPQTGT